MSDQFSNAGFTADSPPDSAVRRAALDPGQSFAVSAPAGSGKTGLLTQRVLTLLAYCDEPEEILAITFTRKAAGEMQNRILQALWHAAEEPQPLESHAALTWQLAQQVLQRDQQRNWQLLLSPQRLRVQTIDSLCRSITRQLPLASGLGAQPDTLEDADLAYRLAVREFFALLEQDTPLRHDLARLLRHLDNNLGAIENLLVALLAKREQWLQILLQTRAEDARAYLESTLQQVITEHLHELYNCLLLHQSDLCEIADQAAQNLLNETPQKHAIHLLHGITALPPIDPDAVTHWQALADLLLTNTGSFRARLTKNEGFPAGKEHASLKEKFALLIAALQDVELGSAALLHSLRELPTANYEDAQWELLDSLTRLLPLLVAQLTLVFKQLGATDYSAISQAALLALGEDDEPSEIALHMDYRIRHILVDEFQDTASPQLHLLQKLTAGWQPGDGRTLFIVGDGMQSCYGFRNANVGLFLDARNQGIGDIHLHALDLSVNFRSHAGIVQWVNETFERAFPTSDDISRGAVKYSPSIAFKPSLPGPAVKVHACLYTQDEDKAAPYSADTATDEEESGGGRQAALLQEAQTVVNLVQQAQAEDGAGSIAILVRTRSHLAQILPALSAAGLSWQATDIDSLASRMTIVDLMSLTRALLNPADRIAWLAVLRAPWCGLDLHDLYYLVNNDLGELSPRPNLGDFPIIWQQLLNYQQIGELSGSGRQAIARLMDALVPAWAGRQRKTLRQWVEGIWLALGGPATLLDSDEHENIESYFALLEQHQEAGGIRDWQSFRKAVEKLYAAPKTSADPRLQVMTIHKAKGLEFDTVIIPALDRRPRKDDHELLLWHERLDQYGERKLLLGPLAATGESHGQLYRFMRMEKDKQQHFEATRLLYVGCTRAVKNLHLLACLPTKNEVVCAPAKSSLLASIWEKVKDEIRPSPIRASAINKTLHTEQKPGLQHILRLRPEWRMPALADVRQLVDYRGHEYQDDENHPELETRSNRLARHSGTLLHRALQVITENNLASQLHGNALVIYLQQQTPFWQIQLRQLGWQGTELTSAIEKVTRAVSRMLSDTRGQWILDNTHTHSACELVLYYQQDRRLRESIIDRTFIADGKRWIIDYKSSEPAPQQTRKQFIDQEVASYRLQMARYRECFAVLENGISTGAAFYFPLLEENCWVDIDQHT